MKKSLLLIAIGVLFIQCKDDDSTGSINIRLENVSSDITFENINFRNKDYGTLSPGDVSEYQSYTKTYSYGYVQIGARDTIFEIIPIDFVGETPLPNGFYTYYMDVNDENNPTRLMLTFTED